MRTTIKDLEFYVKRLNEAKNRPTSAKRKENGKFYWNIGAFTFSGAYGKYALHEIFNDSGAVHSHSAYLTKKDLCILIKGMIAGASNKTKKQ